MSNATAAIDSIGPARLRNVVCQKCGKKFSRWYRGTVRVGAAYMTGMRLSGYRLLAEHLEEGCGRQDGPEQPS